MATMKNRVEKLEAAVPAQENRITRIERVIIGETNPDGSPVVMIRHIA